MDIYQNNEPFEIVVDDRERESDVIDCLRGIPAVSVRIDRLPLGDYQANRRLLFERKTLNDFTRSIVDGRLFNQMIRRKTRKEGSFTFFRDSPGSDMNALCGFWKSSGVSKK